MYFMINRLLIFVSLAAIFAPTSPANASFKQPAEQRILDYFDAVDAIRVHVNSYGPRDAFDIWHNEFYSDTALSFSAVNEHIYNKFMQTFGDIADQNDIPIFNKVYNPTPINYSRENNLLKISFSFVFHAILPKDPEKKDGKYETLVGAILVHINDPAGATNDELSWRYIPEPFYIDDVNSPDLESFNRAIDMSISSVERHLEWVELFGSNIINKPQ